MDTMSSPVRENTLAPKQKSNTAMMVGMLLVVIVLIAGFSAGGYYLGRYAGEQAQQSSSSTSSSSSNSSSSETNSTADEYEGWKIYENTVHGYSFRYPADWTINVENADLVEDYQDNDCCNYAYVTLSSDDGAIWEFGIAPLITGGDFGDNPVLCAPTGEATESLCSSTADNESFTIFGEDVTKVRYFVIEDGMTYLTAFSNETGEPYGFGTLPAGYNDEYYSPTQIYYTLVYKGDSIDDNMETLDLITKSLSEM